MKKSAETPNLILSIIDKMIDFFTRRKLLYKAIGWLVAVSLLSELVTASLPDAFEINYEELRGEYGFFPVLLIALFIGFYAGGYDLLSISIKTVIVMICLYIDFRVQTNLGNNRTFWNIFMGIKQNITLNQNGDEKED